MTRGEVGLFGKSREIRPDRIDTVIGRETKCSGTIEVSGALRIEGQVEGTVCGEGDVTVGEAASVEANIQGRNITIAGRVKGNVEARGRLELMPTAHMEGDIMVAKLMISPGAHFAGKSTMKAEEDTSSIKRAEEKTNRSKDSTKLTSESKPSAATPPASNAKNKKNQ